MWGVFWPKFRRATIRFPFPSPLILAKSPVILATMLIAIFYLIKQQKKSAEKIQLHNTVQSSLQSSKFDSSFSLNPLRSRSNLSTATIKTWHNADYSIRHDRARRGSYTDKVKGFPPMPNNKRIRLNTYCQGNSNPDKITEESPQPVA